MHPVLFICTVYINEKFDTLVASKANSRKLGSLVQKKTQLN